MDPSDQPDLWRLQRTTLGSEFAGRIREYQSDALKLSFVDACQARLYRTPQEVAAGEGGKYFAVFQLEGTAGMAQGNDKVLLSPATSR